MRPMMLLIVPLLLAAAPAAAQDMVEGTVTYDDQTVAMTHVYARETRGSPTADDPPQVVVLVADRAAPAKVIASRQAYYAAAREGRLRGLIVTFEDATPKVRLALFVPGASDDTSVPDVFESIELTEFKREGGTVSGRLRTKEPRRLLPDDPRPETPLTYALDLRFRAAIVRAAQPTQVLTGPAAQASEPVAVAQRMLELLGNGSSEEIKALLLPGHAMAQALGSGEARAMMATARKLLPPPATFRRSVQRVTFYGDEAAVVAKDNEGTTSVWLRRVDGRWMLADAPIPND